MDKLINEYLELEKKLDGFQGPHEEYMKIKSRLYDVEELLENKHNYSVNMRKESDLI
jgi:hypothetical protein